VELWFSGRTPSARPTTPIFKNIFARRDAGLQGGLRASRDRLPLHADRRRRGPGHEARGRLPLGVSNYDGDVFSDVVASGFGSLGMMTSSGVAGRQVRVRGRPRTVRRHYSRAPQGPPHEHEFVRRSSPGPAASGSAGSWTPRRSDRLRGERSKRPSSPASRPASHQGPRSRSWYPRPACHQSTEGSSTQSPPGSRHLCRGGRSSGSGPDETGKSPGSGSLQGIFFLGTMNTWRGGVSGLFYDVCSDRRPVPGGRRRPMGRVSRHWVFCGKAHRGCPAASAQKRERSFSVRAVAIASLKAEGQSAETSDRRSSSGS